MFKKIILTALVIIITISTINHQIIVPSQEDYNFSENNFKKWLIRLEIKHPDIVFRQAKLECGFKSNLFKKNNNLFGMRHPWKRKTTSLGSKNGFANYYHWIFSVIDYKLYQATYYKGGDYCEFLHKAGYAEDIEYIKKLLK